MSEVLCIETQDQNFYGKITTDVYEIEWRFSQESQCCERPTVVFSQDINWLQGKKISSFDFNVYNRYAELILIIEDNDNFEVRFQNDHNGYYPHNLDIYIDGNIKWNTAL
uniref:Uncharacterized protein n=1 Tax=viral metagenome TaxID=1070528 RepID=A0A6C0JWT2_9ZZZZ